MIKAVIRTSFRKALHTGFVATVILANLGVATPLLAQQREPVQVQDVWASRKFAPKGIRSMNWMKDSRYYTKLETDANSESFVIRCEALTGKNIDTLFRGKDLQAAGARSPFFSDYEFNATEDYLLLQTEVESIYRRSSKAEYYIHYRGDGKAPGSRRTFALSRGGAQSYATFSPNGKAIAFARENNLYLTEVESMKEIPVTTDGSRNTVINGSCDWVYEEEFEFAQAFAWNADGKYLAYYRFDETDVPTYNMQMWGELYPQDYLYKYPKAGEKNAVVSIKVYDVTSQKTVTVDVGPEKDQYIPRIKWSRNPGILSVQRMNRLQNTLELLNADPSTGKTTLALKETSPQYVEVTDDLYYTTDGKSFLWTSERDGYRHVYQYDVTGKLTKQLTTGKWEITKVHGLDEKTGNLYFTSTEKGPGDRQLWVVNVKNGKKRQLTIGAGTHEVNISTDFRYFLDNYSTANTPSVYTLNETATGKTIKVLEDNAALRERLSKTLISPAQFFTLTTDAGVELNAWKILPTDFSPNKKYPVLMFVYGGPGSQQVLDHWMGQNYLWYQHLANQGYAVVCVDNRGTGGRGAEFKKCTYGQLGKLETQDQIAAARWLQQQSWVDAQRIGIWGWSFGGYMTSLCLTVGADVFKLGVAVAPVTNWRFYDSIYTERFLKTPQLNPAGYDDNSPVTHAAKLKGKFLLVHGTGDDNVHIQNAIQMQEALIKANKQFQSFYYPNRNHGIYGGVTRLHLYNMMTDFIKSGL